MIPVSLLSVFVLSLPAAEPSPSSSVVLKAARVFDGTSDQPVANGMVLIEGKLIKAVGREFSVPEGSSVIDLGDVTLCPGFIDAHTHLVYGGQRAREFEMRFLHEFLELPCA